MEGMSNMRTGFIGWHVLQEGMYYWRTCDSHCFVFLSSFYFGFKYNCSIISQHILMMNGMQPTRRLQSITFVIPHLEGGNEEGLVPTAVDVVPANMEGIDEEGLILVAVDVAPAN